MVRCSWRTIVALGVLACQARGGNPGVDRNGDGIIDASEGTVRAPDVITQQAPSSPVGTVSGIITDAYTGAPVEGVRVYVNSAALTPGRQDDTGNDNGVLETLTRADGYYALRFVPIGGVTVYFVKDGYTSTSAFVIVSAGDSVGVPTDNTVTNLDIAIIVISDSGLEFNVVDNAGNLVDGAEVSVLYATAFRTNNGSSGGSGSTSGNGELEPVGFATQIVKVVNGHAVIKAPDYKHCNGTFTATVPVVTIVSCSADRNGDLTPDLVGSLMSFTKQALCQSSAQITITLTAANIATGASGFTHIATSFTTDTALNLSPPVQTNQTMYVRMNGQVNRDATYVFVTNGFAHDQTPGNGIMTASALDNSSPFDVDERNFLLEPFNFVAPVTLDPDGAGFSFAPPPGGWPAGQEFVVHAFVSPELPISAPVGAATVDGFIGGFATASPAGPIKVLKIGVSRDQAGGGVYVRVHVLLDRVIQGLNNNIIVCSVDDLQGIADPYNGALDTLVAGRCPTKARRARDVAGFGNTGNGRATIRARTGATFFRTGHGNIVEFLISDVFTNGSVGLDGPLQNRAFKTANLKFLFNQIVDGTMFEYNGGVVTTVENTPLPPDSEVAFTIDVDAALRLGIVSADTNLCFHTAVDLDPTQDNAISPTVNACP